MVTERRLKTIRHYVPSFLGLVLRIKYWRDMILYSPKGTKTWTSSGVIVNNGKLEMSNFSFVEESFVAAAELYTISIIGKNIIGNGLFIISVHFNGILAATENLSFSNISHSKKQIQICPKIGSKVRVSISRGKNSSGKILIDQTAIHLVQPTISDPEIGLEPKTIDEQPIIKDEVVVDVTAADIIVPAKKERKKRTTKPKIKKDDVATDIIAPVIIEKRTEAKERISAAIIDLNIINSERDFFNFLNQISFGKNTQRFFVRQSISDPKDLTKYPNVVLFSSEQDLIEDLARFDVFKIFYNKGNLQGALLEKAEELKGSLL